MSRIEATEAVKKKPQLHTEEKFNNEAPKKSFFQVLTDNSVFFGANNHTEGTARG